MGSTAMASTAHACWRSVRNQHMGLQVIPHVLVHSQVAGDADTLTAFQMDIKVEGITLDIMRAALAQVRWGSVLTLG